MYHYTMHITVYTQVSKHSEYIYINMWHFIIERVTNLNQVDDSILTTV